MESAESIRQRAIDASLELLQDDAVNEIVSSTFYGDAREKLTPELLDKIVISKPDDFAKTSLARAMSAIMKGHLYSGKITLYKPFFDRFNISIGPDATSDSIGLSMKQRRTIVMLHELTHVTRKYVDAFQFFGMNYFDEAIYDQCTINKRLFNACKSLEAFES